MSLWTWWILYTLFAIWGQTIINGVDLFSPGLIVCLQDKKYKTALGLTICWMFIQEGTNVIAFGSEIIFFACLWAIFFLGITRFESENPLFVIFLSFVLTICHTAIYWLMFGLQGIHFISGITISACSKQFTVFIAVWGITYLLYKRVITNDPI